MLVVPNVMILGELFRVLLPVTVWFEVRVLLGRGYPPMDTSTTSPILVRVIGVLVGVPVIPRRAASFSKSS